MATGSANRLPLLDFVVEHYPDADLSKVAIIACQHILPTTLTLFEKMFSLGLQPERVFLLGKCYSTNQETFTRFQEAGVHTSEKSFAFNSHQSFDEQYSVYVQDFLSAAYAGIAKQEIEKIVLMDDGGYLIASAHQCLQAESRLRALEQTSSGYEKIRYLQLHFPVINVARSFAKLSYESPFIAQDIVRKLILALDRYRLDNPKILIIGNGNVGAEIASLLKSNYQVTCADILPQKCDYGGQYRERLKDYNVIIGATGATVLSPTEIDCLKPGTLLVSASSSDREFSAVHLRLDVPRSNNCHVDVRARDIYLLNSGFPINFDGEEGIPPQQIQLTRSLLLAGLLQAMKSESTKDVADLDEGIQRSLLAKFKTLIGP